MNAFRDERCERTFARPGYSTVTYFGNLEEAYAQARDFWEQEGREKAAALNVTAEEYARQARRGLVAQHIEANAHRYAATADTPAKQAMAASLYRQAAKAHDAE